MCGDCLLKLAENHVKRDPSMHITDALDRAIEEFQDNKAVCECQRTPAKPAKP